MSIVKNRFKSKVPLLLILMVVGAVFCHELVLAGTYKCRDDNDNVTYTDERCLNQTREDLDIIVAPVDEDAAERLKYYQNKISPDPGPKNKITTLKQEQPNPACELLAQKIKQHNERLRSGYTPEQGEAARKTKESLTEMYRNCK